MLKLRPTEVAVPVERAAALVLPPTLEDADEGHAEASVAQSVAHRVDRRVHVAQAVADGEQHVRDRVRKEGLPADDY